MIDSEYHFNLKKIDNCCAFNSIGLSTSPQFYFLFSEGLTISLTGFHSFKVYFNDIYYYESSNYTFYEQFNLLIIDSPIAIIVGSSYRFELENLGLPDYDRSDLEIRFRILNSGGFQEGFDYALGDLETGTISSFEVSNDQGTQDCIVDIYWFEFRLGKNVPTGGSIEIEFPSGEFDFDTYPSECGDISGLDIASDGSAKLKSKIFHNFFFSKFFYMILKIHFDHFFFFLNYLFYGFALFIVFPCVIIGSFSGRSRLSSKI